jgi:NAD(P)-dependent dehydrogenase (short-subunit alcohol dehydrogenase family)
LVEDSSKRVALISGGNKGIGFEIARRLGQAGLTVFAGARNRDLGAAAARKLQDEGLDVRHIELDLLRPATLEAAAVALGAEFQRLDVLVNNAAIIDSGDGPPSTVEGDAVRHSMETNFFGTLALTRAMLPLLRQAPAARIVNVSSGLGSITLNGDPEWIFAPYKLLGYCASKAALNMLTVQLAFELRGTAIKVNSADPGFTATDMNDNRGTQTVEEGAAEPVRLALLPAEGPTGGFSDRAGRLPW